MGADAGAEDRRLRRDLLLIDLQARRATPRAVGETVTPPGVVLEAARHEFDAEPAMLHRPVS